MDNRVTILKPNKEADESKGKANKLSPGDIVRITQNAYENDIGSRNPIVAVVGSTAVVLSLEEYATSIENLLVPERDAYLKMVKEWIETGYQYPFRFLTVANQKEVPLSMNGGIMILDEYCELGQVILLDERFFEVIEKKEKSDKEEES
jgi:hypothetical protein